MNWIRKWGNPKPESETGIIVPEMGTPHEPVAITDFEGMVEAYPEDVEESPRSNQGRKSKPLAKQFGKAMRDNLTDKELRPFAKRCNLQPGTVTRVMSGVGTNLATLEAVAREMSWTITVTDAKGKILAQT